MILSKIFLIKRRRKGGQRGRGGWGSEEEGKEGGESNGKMGALFHQVMISYSFF